MIMPSGTTWNMDWEQAVNYNNINWADVLRDISYIEPFIKATNERIAAIDGGNGIGDNGKGLYPTIPASGYGLLSQAFVVNQGGDLVTSLLRNDVIGTAYLGPGVIQNPMLYIDDTGVSSPKNNRTYHYASASTTAIGQAIASGYVSWPTLQLAIQQIASRFVIPNTNYSSLTFNDIPGTFFPQLIPESIVPTTSIYPSGFSSYTPITNGFGSSTVNFNNQLYNAPLLVSNWPSGNTSIYIVNDRSWFFYDNFPLPSGFRRKFPREIFSLDYPGIDGQIARYSYRDISLGPNTGLPMVSGYQVKSIISRYTNNNYYWFGDVRNSVYYRNPPVPIMSGIFSMQELSGNIYKYIGSSGWILNDNQNIDPDIVTTYGLIDPGDYFGPWILNDLRDAINLLTDTFQSYNNLYYSQVPRSAVLTSTNGVASGNTIITSSGLHSNYAQNIYRNIDLYYLRSSSGSNPYQLQYINTVSGSGIALTTTTNIPSNVKNIYALVNWGSGFIYTSGTI